jgi:NodT family efflux transporter outer membrane factor (OMF) lipoprotein
MTKKITVLLLFSSIFMLGIFAFRACAQDVAASQDIELKDGKWIEMAQRYPIPAVSGDASVKLTPEILAKWWENLGDETLTQLIGMSLRNNRDLVSARAKVTEARASLGISKAAVLPWLDTTDYWTRGRTPVEAGGTGNVANLFRLGIDASWEIDVFGGQKQTIKAGVATLEAQYASLHATWVTLSSEVALNYLTLRTLQERLDIAKSNLALQNDTLEMLQSRLNAGLSDELALNQAKYTMEQTKATIPPIETSIEEVKNNLAVLTGSVPGSLEEMLGNKKPLPEPADKDFIGIPANAIRQRPDIRAAERQLAAQIARKKSAEADLWPKFYLFGSIGTEALDTGSLFEGPAKIYSFGPKITWPIFHWGAIKNNIRVHGARQEQYLAAYEQTVLKAVGEVRNALTSGIQERTRNEALARGVSAAQIALDVANDKYKNGLTDFNNVISAQRALLVLSEEYAISRGQVVSNMVQLYKALGGGWAPLFETGAKLQ